MLLSSDVVDEIRDALADGEEEYARMILRDHESTLSCRQKELVKNLFRQFKQECMQK